MEYVKVGQTADIPANTMTMVLVGSKEVLLANVDGAYYAIANKCSHRGGPLAQGQLEGGIVTCPWHGARFDVRTGEAAGEFKLGLLKLKLKDEPSYSVKVEGADILVGIE
ncbi:MAG: Rieske 2Fe-2S domain-containing protein [Anaerolineaceae bacterium]